MTECGGAVTVQQSHHKNGSCGTIIANGEMKIMDPDNGKTLGPNQTGEVCIKVATMMNGYYRNPEATKHVFDEEGKKFNEILSTIKIITSITSRMVAFGRSRLHRWGRWAVYRRQTKRSHQVQRLSNLASGNRSFIAHSSSGDGSRGLRSASFNWRWASGCFCLHQDRIHGIAYY